MSENEPMASTSISGAQSVEEVAEYWATHSLDDHWDETSDILIEVRAQRRHRVNVDPEVFDEIRLQARQRGIAAETLINLWLRERLAPGVVR